MPFDPKWRVVAKRAGQPIASIVGIFATMMIAAGDVADEDDRGSLNGWRIEEIAEGFDMDEAELGAVFEAMRGRVHDGERLTGWERRNPKREDETGAARQAKHRARTRAAGAGDGAARAPALRNARSESDQSRESESRGGAGRSNLRVIGGPDLDALKAAIFAATGAALDERDPRIHDLTPILGLMGPGRGPPCSLELDILPALRERSAAARPGSVYSLGFFKNEILRKRDRRLGGAPGIDPANLQENEHGRSGPGRRSHDAGGRGPATGTMADVVAAKRRARPL